MSPDVVAEPWSMGASSSRICDTSAKSIAAASLRFSIQRRQQFVAMIPVFGLDLRLRPSPSPQWSRAGCHPGIVACQRRPAAGSMSRT